MESTFGRVLFSVAKKKVTYKKSEHKVKNLSMIYTESTVREAGRCLRGYSCRFCAL
jgi:hypothetical protein